jgi:hypothetical protein
VRQYRPISLIVGIAGSYWRWQFRPRNLNARLLPRNGIGFSNGDGSARLLRPAA